MFIIWQTRKINSFNVTGCVLAGILLENGYELNLILPEFARSIVERKKSTFNAF